MQYEGVTWQYLLAWAYRCLAHRVAHDYGARPDEHRDGAPRVGRAHPHCRRLRCRAAAHVTAPVEHGTHGLHYPFQEHLQRDPIHMERSKQLKGRARGTQDCRNSARHSQHLSFHVDGARRTPKIFLYDWRGTATITTASTPRATRRRGVRYARGPRRTICSHDRQRAPRKLSVHAVVLCASCSPLYCPGASRPRQACSRLTSRFRVASYCRRVDLECD